MKQDQPAIPSGSPSGYHIGPIFRKIFNIHSELFSPRAAFQENTLFQKLSDDSAEPPVKAPSPLQFPFDQLWRTKTLQSTIPSMVSVEPMDQEFCEFVLKSWIPSQGSQEGTPCTFEDLQALLDELVSMALPLTALALMYLEPSLKDAHSFAPQLGIGISAMLLKEFPTAEAAFRKAQALLPEEPAPYVNLIQIFIETDRLQDADLWLDAGLEAAPNHHHLWELLYHRFWMVHGDYAPEKILEEARKRCSWTGTSLAASLVSTGDRHFKARELERFYHLGERDPLFLIELTGAYGVSEEFDKIPPIVWQAQKMSTKVLPWQLHAHGAQAELSLGSKGRAQTHIDLARKDRFISPEGLLALNELESELASL